MLSFSFDLQKLKSTEIANRRAHNLRDGDTHSQLDKRLWFSKNGRKTIVEWDSDRLELAKKLSKRKDAVHVFSVVLQVGNQADWRFEDGQQKAGNDLPASFENMELAAKKWAVDTFGLENIVSIEAHFDESSPHFHILATPIKNGKLQAKHWFQKGLIDLREMRKNACLAFNEAGVECGYTPSRTGGKPHDSSKATGGGQSRQLADQHEKTKRIEAELKEALRIEGEQDDQLQSQAKLIQKQHTHSRWLESELNESKKQVGLVTKELISSRNEVNSLKIEINSLNSQLITLHNEIEKSKNIDIVDKTVDFKGLEIDDITMDWLLRTFAKDDPSCVNFEGCEESHINKRFEDWDNAILILGSAELKAKSFFENECLPVLVSYYSGDEPATLAKIEAALAQNRNTPPQHQQKTILNGSESTRTAISKSAAWNSPSNG